MDCASGDVATISFAISGRTVESCEGHFAIENDVGCFRRMSVVWIMRVRPIFPSIGVGESFATKLLRERLLIHGSILSIS